MQDVGDGLSRTHGVPGESTETLEQQLLDFFENGSVALHWVASDGRILWANAAEMQLLGYEPHEYIGHHVSEFHADEDVIRDIMERLNANETLNNHEARLRCKDGSIKHVLISSNVYRCNGEFIHTRCFTRDITDRKLAEEALRHSEARYRAIFNQVLVGIAETDLTGRYIMVNDRSARSSADLGRNFSACECMIWRILRTYREILRSSIRSSGEDPMSSSNNGIFGPMVPACG